MSVRVRPIAVLVAALAVVAVGAVGLSGAHGTHVEITPQVVSDGQVVVDGVNTATDGFLVIHRDDGGDPGEALGSVSLEAGFREDLTVDVSGSLDGPTTLWAVVHGDDGDGTFEPGDDPPIRSLGGIAGRQFQVRPGERPVYVLTHSVNAQPSNRSVLVNAAAMDGPGHLVVHADDRGRLGEVVGNRSIPAGVSRNVVVNVSNSTYDGQRNYYRLWAVLYSDDGDGVFEAEADDPVTVGGERVAKRFQTRVVEDVPARWVRGGPTPTPATTTSGGSGTTDGGSGQPTGSPGTTTGEAAGVGADGFGTTVGVLAVLAAAALFVVYRRR